MPLGREAVEARAALNQQDPERLLQPALCRRRGRLGDAAGLGRAAEMVRAGEREQEFELVDHSAKPSELSVSCIEGSPRSAMKRRTGSRWSRARGTTKS